MNKELLRIYDEDTACDLVAVSNPNGNFHMSTYAEDEDGNQKPVDDWYMLQKVVDCIDNDFVLKNSILIEKNPNYESESNYPYVSFGKKYTGSWNAFKELFLLVCERSVDQETGKSITVITDILAREFGSKANFYGIGPSRNLASQKWLSTYMLRPINIDQDGNLKFAAMKFEWEVTKVTFTYPGE